VFSPQSNICKSTPESQTWYIPVLNKLSSLVCLLTKTFILFGFPIFLSRAYIKNAIPETRSAIYKIYLRYYYYHWVDTSDCGLLVPEIIVHSVVSVSALTWLIRYIYYWNLQFLYTCNVIINKPKLPLQAYVTVADFSYPF